MEKEEEKHEIVKEDGLEPEKKALNGYAKYTSVAFQMMAIIGAFAFIGYKIDQYYDHKPQWVTAIACVLGVCFSIYQTIRQLKS
ncbi:AtpZ/AtpI family protein [Daejeonella sp.]|uniref:AtpZ/AtpI family protein n=1 Tax=Daejeonella sp. TaxID=2805397 RepID=UPI0030C419A1